MEVKEEEDNNDNSRDVIFMVIIQDENSIGVKFSTKRDPSNNSRMKKKWKYHGIHPPSPKSEEKKK